MAVTANLYRVGDEKVDRGTVHFEHAVENGVSFGQLWFAGRWHLEFTKAALEELARDAANLARNL